MSIHRPAEWCESRVTHWSERNSGVWTWLLTFAGYSPVMAKEIEKDPLGRWRRAETDYAAAITGFMQGDSDHLSKDGLIALIDLRSKADKWREKYFKKHHKS